MNVFHIAVGAALSCVGLAGLIQRIHFYRHSVRVDGKVTDCVEDRPFYAKAGSTARYYRKVVTFAAADGSTHEVRSNTRSLAQPARGEACPVRYDPRDPSAACVATMGNFWITRALLLAAGVGIVILGVRTGR